MEIFTADQVPQGSPEWFKVRAGIPTASEFATVMATGRGGGESKTRSTYLYKLAGERITDEPAESFSNAYMERGKILEPEARNLYAFLHDVEPYEVGFVRDGNKGASPDSLIGDDGALEIKTKAPHLLIDILRRQEMPAEHMAQVQGVMWIAQRKWLDFVAYYPKMPLFLKRIYRDDIYIAKMSRAVAEFNDELETLVEEIRKMGQAA